MKQMRVLNINDPYNIREIGSFSPSGFAVQEGKVLSFFKNKSPNKNIWSDKYSDQEIYSPVFSLGRTVGGFNNISNHELFIFSTTSDTVPMYSRDIPGGVYGILIRPPNIYISTKSPGKEFQILDQTLQNKILDYPLGFLPNSFICDRNTFYFSTGDHRGIGILKII